uniref:Fibrinogen-related protein 1 isoform 1 n=1 Tax=Magallana gigas TaxID=29159 RepID=A0A173FZB6_MAGGI|nr:fibrinogen-related protein 1 isoform 1 [Crassostrea gigas]|eukprot:XP_019918471.1 PREDICTED: fibrinogen-like protein A [Crassostrea gigas]
MGRLFGILILTSLLVSLNGQVLFDDIGDRQRSADLALQCMRTGLQQFSQGIGKMVTKKLEEVENIIEAKMDQIETKNNKSLSTIQTELSTIQTKLSTIQTEQRLLRQGMRVLRYTEINSIAGFDCADILEYFPDTRGRDGVYNIIDIQKAKAVYCDMTTDNGGWTVIQRRVNGSVDFNRNWTEYKNGFGFADHEYWIGNDMLHRLTSTNPQELRVDMERFNGEKAYAVYSKFSVGDEASKYQLRVTGYSGNAGDSLSYSNNMKFSTPDQDNDGSGGFNCALFYRTAGWFDSCFDANPNGQYTDSEKTDWKYITWKHWKDSYISLKSIQLMIRPRA